MCTGWFDDQIKLRRLYDGQLLDESVNEAGRVIYGRRKAFGPNEKDGFQFCVNAILRYYHLPPCAAEDTEGGELEERLDRCLNRYGMIKREVSVGEGLSGILGPVLAFLKDSGEPVALFPGIVTDSFYFRAHRSERKTRLTKKNAGLFSDRAYCFLKPFPRRKLDISDLTRYMRECLTAGDAVLLSLGTAGMTAFEVIIPFLVRGLASIPGQSGASDALAGIAVWLLCAVMTAGLSGWIFRRALGIVTLRLSLKTQAAIMMRVMEMPSGRLSEGGSAQAAGCLTAAERLCRLIAECAVGAGLPSLSAIVSTILIAVFAPALLAPSLIMATLTLLIGFASALTRLRSSGEQMEREAREASLRYGIINGIRKIKLAGAEKRFFARWLSLFARSRAGVCQPPAAIRFEEAAALTAGLLTSIAIYVTASKKGGITAADYLAFSSAYGVLTGALSRLAAASRSAGEIKTCLKAAGIFLNSEPESGGEKRQVASLTGSIEINGLYFRYGGSPYILKNLSLKIRPREYVAVVGGSGCGKSTLVKLLLGFESPERGGIFYDGFDLKDADLSSLRRQIGSVMQHGRLAHGDIYSNIALSSPGLSEAEVWEAAETAGIANDIRNMPMGLRTVISEETGGLSGGQKQRVFIARAVAQKPKILIFDEATSALDNITQKNITNALYNLKCTRIVIAHRLSTVRLCDRILVLDGGRIVEDGTYDELIQRNGVFARLVSRQRL